MAEEAHPDAEATAEAKGSTQAPATADSSVGGKEETPIYEVGFHIVPTAGDEHVARVVDTIRKALGVSEIISEGFPQRQRLAYIIERPTEGKREKYSEAYFGWMKFAMEREMIPGLEKSLRGAKEVLRYLLIETVREDIKTPTARAVYASDRLEGQTLKKPIAQPEKAGEVSEEELDKSIEALVSPGN